MSTKNHKHFEKIITDTEGAELGNILLDKYEGSKRWDPSGKNRAMKDWIQVPQKYRSDWNELTTKAVDFMA